MLKIIEVEKCTFILMFITIKVYNENFNFSLLSLHTHTHTHKRTYDKKGMFLKCNHSMCNYNSVWPQREYDKRKICFETQSFSV